MFVCLYVCLSVYLSEPIPAAITILLLPHTSPSILFSSISSSHPVIHLNFSYSHQSLIFRTYPLLSLTFNTPPSILQSFSLNLNLPNFSFLNLQHPALSIPRPATPPSGDSPEHAIDPLNLNCKQVKQRNSKE